MKKNLLLAAMIAATLSASAQKDITPKAYQFANRPVGEQLQIQDAVGGWNSNAFSSEEIKKLAPEGGLVSLNASENKVEAMNATCIVDLGGNVGHVLAVTGASMDGLNDAFVANGLGAVKDAPLGTVNKLQLNFYTDPETTPGASVVQADFVVNAWATNTEAGQYVWENFYYMTSDNSVNPNNSNAWQGNGISITDFCQIDEEGDLVTDEEENPIYDPNRWVRYTTYVGTLGEGGQYSNAIKAKLWTGPTFGNVILFIKELSFKTTELNTGSEEFKSQNNHKRTVETYNPDPNKVADAIKNIQAAKNFSISNGTFTSAEYAEVYTLEGKKVFAGTQGQLVPGMYVAKINKVSVKFVVK